MDYTQKLKAYGKAPTQIQIEEAVSAAMADSAVNRTEDVYKLCLSCIDLTSLNVDDTQEKITAMARKAVEFPVHFPAAPNVASICVYPVFIDTVGLALGDSGMKITSVAGGFPSSQTFLEVKMLEIAMAVESGADEIDIVMNVGKMLAGDYNEVAGEIELIGGEVGGDVILKVIIESGALGSIGDIWIASLLSMMAGADFVKTSTGKIPVAATPQAAATMCLAIRSYFEQTGRRVGFKAAGGVRTPEDASLYYTIVKNILGPQWLTPSLFRIGASSAANNILGAIVGREVNYF